MDSTFKLYSTKDHRKVVSLKEAMFQGMADDNGLFFPVNIPELSPSYFIDSRGKTFTEISYEIAKSILGDEIPHSKLKAIILESFPFDAPLVEIKKGVYSQELFHGPTLSFKDFGARFMARLFHHYIEGRDRELNILVATSGDTGSAVADGFYKIPGVKVWVLYPSKKISTIQEQQITTLGENIQAIEVDGTFDDCQKIVKQAFADRELRVKKNITSANSINIARLIPQSFYYFYAYSQLQQEGQKIVISVPSGNYGNLTAGLIAKRMGLPINKFIAATNINDVIPEYLESGLYSPRPSQHTISNAMDVGNPSNFERMQDLFAGDLGQMREQIYGASFTDDETSKAITEVYIRTGYTLDPHGAVAYLGLERYTQKIDKNVLGIFLETAHPAKFADTVEKAIGKPMIIPKRLQDALTEKKQSIFMENSYSDFKSVIG